MWTLANLNGDIDFLVK
jgi:hypothetical protein